MSPSHQLHDKLFKQSLSDIRVAKEFFETHLPKEILDKADLSTLKLQNKSFVDAAYKNTEADVVYGVKIDQNLGYLYVLCEHQTQVDRTLAFRLLVYLVRLMEQHLKQYPKAPLPLVYPLVVYSGERPWNAPQDIFGLFGTQEALARQFLFKPYQLIDIARMSDEDIKKRQWSGLVEFVLKYKSAREFRELLETVLPWIHKIELHEGKDFAKIVVSYVIDGVKAENEQLFIERVNHYLSEEMRGEIMTLAQLFEQRGVERGLQQGLQQGIQQGMTLAKRFEQKGAESERQTVALRLLQEGFSLELISKITGLTPEQLQKLH